MQVVATLIHLYIILRLKYNFQLLTKYIYSKVAANNKVSTCRQSFMYYNTVIMPYENIYLFVIALNL